MSDSVKRRNANFARAVISLGFVLFAGASGANAQTTINGAGSTFAYPMYSKWFDGYQKVDPSVQFNYQSIGSGGGIRQIIEGTVDFGGTDGPMTEDQMKDFKDKRSTGVLHLPMALGAIVPSYNLPGVTQKINFTPTALAGIFLGKITKWNDPEIAKVNTGIKIPTTDIVVVHRSDGSGSTFALTDFLSKVNPEWKEKVGVSTSVNWPVGVGGKGNEGVAGLVKQTPGAIGYVELIYALQNNLLVGKVQNQEGKFIDASLESVTAAAAGTAKTMPSDFRVSITNAAGADSYPISTFTWLLVPEKISDQQKKEAIVKFLDWSLSHGQEQLASLEYARLPKEVIDMEKKTIAKIE